MDNRGPELAAVVILFLILTWLTVGLRCVVRARMIKSFGLDDWIMVLSLAVFTLYCAFALGGVKYGTGRHVPDLTPESISKALRYWFLCELAYVVSTTVLKVAIGLFLLRIAVLRRHIYTVWVVIAATIVFGVFYFFFILFQCSPISYFWNPTTSGGSCITPSAIVAATYAHSAVSAAADWTFGILPVFLIWDVKMNPRTKISIAIILGLGAIGSTATLVRIKYIYGLTQTSDFLYATTDVAIWSTVEPGIGITAASIATLRPLFRTFFNKAGVSSSRGQRASDRTNPWPNSRSGYQRSHGLDELRPDGLADTTITVDSSGPNRSGKGGHGRWLRGMNEGDGTSEEGLTGGISKTTEISYTETPKPREGV